MLKKILPVGIGIVLIILIAVVVSAVKAGNSKTPTFKEAKEIYASYEDYNITYDRLYNAMKNSYGLNELINLVDTDIFADELSANETNKVFESEDYINFIVNAIFGQTEFENLTETEKEDLVEEWNDVCTSLQINAKISKADATASKISTWDLAAVKATKAWAVAVEEYKLSYTRQEWGKKAYWEKYLKDNEVTEDAPFKMTNTDDKENSIEAYYNANYLSTVDGLFIPFTSEAQALKAMEYVGINTNSKVLTSSSTGWVKNSYNYNEETTIGDEDKLSYNEVFEAFVNLYNLVYSYKNNGVIIKAEDYEEKVWNLQTATKAANAIKEQFAGLTLGTSLKMPETLTVKINGCNDATVTWTVLNANYVTYADGVLTGNADEYSENELSFSLSYTLKFEDEEITGTFTNTFSKAEGLSNVCEEFNNDKVEAVEPFKGYVLKESAFEKENAKLNWNTNEATEVNATLAEYLSVDSENLSISSDPTNNLYKSYTMKPVAMGDYYILAIKFADHEVDDLFVKENDEYQKNDDGTYKLCEGGEDIVKEIIAAKKEALLDDNAVTEMLYVARQEHDVKIYDRYIEAVYEYQYKTFYTDTLSKTEYDEYKTTKKNNAKYVVTYNKEAGNKKSIVKVETKVLFDKLEAKYAASVLANLVENYIIISSDFNKVYNSYLSEKKAVIDKQAYHDVLESDAATLKKYFENGNFAQSSLASYGFIPNFPAKYGWANFIKDYFLCYSDQELLTSSAYGGTIYNDTLADFIDSLYSYDGNSDIFNGHTDLDLPTIKSAIQDLKEDYYALKVVNVIVSIDPDYNCDSSSDDAATISAEHRKDWTDEQTQAAKDLLALIFEVANQTNKTTLAAQLTEVAAIYTDAGFDGGKSAASEAMMAGKSIYDTNYFGYYKSLGLKVKAESAAEYDSSSSLVEDFVVVCREVYAKLVKDNLVGKELDAPILTDAFLTDYGYHMFATISSTSMVAEPTEEEIKIYVAQKAIDEVDESISSTESTIAQYTQYGYDVSSYQAQIENYKTKRAALVEKQKDVLNALGKAEDYELDDAAIERLEAWYDDAETAIEEGTIVTKAYVAIFEDTMAKFNFKASTMNSARFEEFVSILKDECLKDE